MTDTDEPKKPGSHLRIAAENAQSKIDCMHAMQRIERPLQALTANLLRVSRGAGHPHEIVEQCVNVVTAFREVYRVCGQWPAAHEVSQILDLNPKYTGDEFTDGIDVIVGGSLRFAAARLLGQATQERRAETELMQGVNEVEKYRQKNWLEREKSSKATRAKTKRKKAPPDIKL